MSGITILGQYKPLTLREDTASKNYFFFRPDDKLADHEEELSIQDNVVIWTAGQIVKRKITLEHRVIQVIWANFSADPNKNTKTDLCILHQEGLYVLVDQGGSSYWDVHVSLPCKMTALWAVHRGVILQRRNSNTSELLTPSEPLPVYFSLLHPLEEIKPLAFLSHPHGTEFTQDLSLVACSDVLPHAVFYHERLMKHSVWLLRRRTNMHRELTYDLANQQDKQPESEREQIQSELFLELIYLAADSSPRATQLVLFNDRELGLHYAVYYPAVHELRTWRIDHVTQLSPGTLTRQHVHAVQPLHGVPHNAVQIGDRSAHVASHVILVVRDSTQARDWTLVVQAVGHQICAWPVAEYLNIPHSVKPRRTATPLALTPTRTPRKGESLTRVIQPSAPELEHVTIEDSIDTRFNVVVQFRAMDPLIYRATLSLAPRSVLTRHVLGALRGVVPPQLYDHTVRVLLLESDLSGGDEWQVFVSFMKQLFRTHLLQSTDNATKNSANQDAWSALLASSHHRAHVEGNFFAKFRKSLPTLVQADSHVPLDTQHVQAFKPYLAKIYHALHLVYEDYKLDQLKIAQLSALATLLLELSVMAQCHAYTDHYLRDVPQLHDHVLAVQQSLTPVKRVNELIPEMATPPSIYFWLISALRHPDNIPPYPLLTGASDSPFEVTRALCRVYHVILTSRDHPQYRPAVPPHLHVTDSLDGTMPPFMNASAPVQTTEVIHEWTHVLAQEANLLEISLPFGVAQLLHEVLASVRHVPPRDCPARLLTALDRLDLLALYFPAMLPPKKFLASTFDPSQSPDDLPESRDRIDGTELSNEVSFMRFAKDTRLKEVRRLLRSSHVFTVHYRHEDGAEDLVAGQQLRLLLHANKYLARTLARGMFTLGTDTQLKPLFSESIPIPELSTTAKFRPQGTTVTLDLTPHPDLLHWPEFHNGVSAGLRVPPELSAEITSTWIIYQKNTPELTNQHAGLLLALGLQGHLRALSLTKVYEYLSVSHELTGIALLLGMAASKLGTQDTAISRLLSVHVTALHPPLSQELDVPFRLQTAALLALGMLYRGTCHRRITEVLLTEIGRKPVEEKQQARPFERESHSLTAGLALGLVVLGRADSAAGLHDLDIQHRLLRYITGGPSDQRSDTRASLLSQRASDRARSSTVLEGTSINVDITAPGAVLALALLYLKSRDRSVAARIDIPDTCFAFQYIRPDLVLLRVLAKNLILWDDIQPTAEWIEGHVPTVMTGVKAQLGREIESGDAQQTLRQGYFNVLTGACLAIGFRFAGTAHTAAKHVLTQYLQYFIKLQRSKFDRADKNMLEYCMNSVALALCMVLSGTGHLGTFKILRTLRKRVSVDVTYGNHMALNMAIGFLFLGGGRYTLDTSPQSIAFLLCAVYPRFPQSCRDNRYHLQALRHMYALAAVPRCIEVRDVDTQRPVYVPLNIHFRPDFDTAEHIIQLTAPCLLPPVQWITKIELATPRYWSLTLSRDRHAATHPLTRVCSDTCHRSPVLHVQRKSAYLDYDLDPDGVKSLAARPYSQTLRLDNLTAVSSVLDAKNRRELLLAFSADPHVLAFATHFASGNDTRQVAFCTAVLLECLSAEKLTMIDTYLTLDRVVQCLTRDGTLSASELWNVKLICQLYARTDWPWLTSDTSPLLQMDYLTAVKLKLENYFENLTRQAGLSRDDWLELAKKGNLSSPTKQRHVAHLAHYFEVPPAVSLSHVLNMPRPDTAHWTLFLAPLAQFSELQQYDASTVLFLARVLSSL